MASQDVTISQYKRSILVAGNTFPIKDALKSLGGSWNKYLKGWIFRQRDREAVVARLRAIPGIAVTDQTPEGVAGGVAGAATATAAASEVDDYSDLAANPTPNKGSIVTPTGGPFYNKSNPPPFSPATGTFGESGVPGERMAASLPEQVRHHPMFGVGGRTLEFTTHGDLFEMRSRRELEKKAAEDQDNAYDGGGE